MNMVLLIAIFACLAFIPASIAEKKGHSFLLWWLYGFVLFFAALVHAHYITDYHDDDYFDEVILRSSKHRSKRKSHHTHRK